MNCTLCKAKCGLENQQAGYLYGDHFLCENCLKREDPEYFHDMQSAAQELRAFKARTRLKERDTRDLGCTKMREYKVTGPGKD